MRTIWLASFPKSGNTWLRLLIANLQATDERPIDINDLATRAGIASRRELFDELMLIDSGLLTFDEIDNLRPCFYEHAYKHFDACSDEDLPKHLHKSPAGRMAATGAHNKSDKAVGMPSVRFVKVHDAYTLTLKGEPLLGGERAADGAIVIVRDPRDVAPSLANHNSTTVDDAIAFMADRAAAFCANTRRQPSQLRQKLLGWSGHVASWLDQSDLPIHLIRYEDMQADTTGTLSRAMAFAQYDVDAGQIERAAKQASFAELQAQELTNGFREAPRPAAGGRFFRRGIAGAWRDELTPAQTARLEADHTAMMMRLGYDLASAAMPTHVYDGGHDGAAALDPSPAA